MAFTIRFYKSSAEEKRVDKSGYLVDALTVTGTLREETSIIRPTILFEYTGAPTDRLPPFNYAYIAEFDRYYFVTDIVSVRNNLWEISMECDVLYTYKDGIIEDCYGFVDRCEEGYDPLVIDNLRTVLSGVDVEDVAVTNNVFTDNGNFLLTGFTIGMGI